MTYIHDNSQPNTYTLTKSALISPAHRGWCHSWMFRGLGATPSETWLIEMGSNNIGYSEKWPMISLDSEWPYSRSDDSALECQAYFLRFGWIYLFSDAAYFFQNASRITDPLW